MKLITKCFTRSLLNWYSEHGRKDLPWQNPYSDYRVWLSEIMLQQTQVKTVIPYFLRFIERYPDITTLAHAPLDDVLALWSGLGYYSRARNLHRTAQIIVSEWQGKFPPVLSDLQKLPGIGPSTAAAIASLAFQQPCAILDGNVKRVLSRYFLLSGPETLLWQQAQACMPQLQCREYTQAIMDMGATCCTHKHPQCLQCPLNRHCLAFQQQVVDDYPPKKAKKIRPTRHEQFLLLHTTDQKIYLEQRPQQGIWGGLWCPPSLDSGACAKSYLQTHYAVVAPTITPLTAFKHSFTHFHLQITAYAIPTELNPTLPGRWVMAEELDNIGLAKPMKKIMMDFLLDLPQQHVST